MKKHIVSVTKKHNARLWYSVYRSHRTHTTKKSAYMSVCVVPSMVFYRWIYVIWACVRCTSERFRLVSVRLACILVRLFTAFLVAVAWYVFSFRRLTRVNGIITHMNIIIYVRCWFAWNGCQKDETFTIAENACLQANTIRTSNLNFYVFCCIRSHTHTHIIDIEYMFVLYQITVQLQTQLVLQFLHISQNSNSNIECSNQYGRTFPSLVAPFDSDQYALTYTKETTMRNTKSE